MADRTDIDMMELRREALHLVRNSGVLSDSQRGVTSTTDTGTFSSDTSHLISVTNGKAISSIVVDGSPLVYGKDYTYLLDYDDSGTIKIQVNFTSAQTGAYTITYDFGTDKIFPDYPRTELSISSFPRVAVDVSDITTGAGGFGSVDESEVNVTVTLYSPTTLELSNLVSTLRAYIRSQKTGTWFLGNYIQIVSISPAIVAERAAGKDKIFQQTLDFRGRFRYEV